MKHVDVHGCCSDARLSTTSRKHSVPHILRKLSQTLSVKPKIIESLETLENSRSVFFEKEFTFNSLFLSAAGLLSREILIICMIALVQLEIVKECYICHCFEYNNTNNNNQHHTCWVKYFLLFQCKLFAKYSNLFILRN